MFDRKAFTYKVKLQKETGQTLERNVTCYWSPEHTMSREYAANAAMAMEGRRTGVRHIALASAELVT